MAITSTNSNSVNINNLPKAQLAVDTDLLILQTTNGTQAIPFSDLNVVRTDINGNATVVGNLTGNAVQFSDVTVRSLTASSINVPGAAGISQPADYYNYLTIQNGIVTAAVPTADTYTTDPMYLQVQADIANSISSTVIGVVKTVDAYGSTTIVESTSANTLTIGGFFQTYPTIDPSTITPAHFTLSYGGPPPTATTTSNSTITLSGLGSLSALGSTGVPALSSSSALTALTALPFNSTVIRIQSPLVPYIAADSILRPATTDDLQFEVNLGAAVTVDTPVYYRMLLTSPI